MANELGSTIITLPLIAILESVAIAKAFGKCKLKWNNPTKFYITEDRKLWFSAIKM